MRGRLACLAGAKLYCSLLAATHHTQPNKLIKSVRWRGAKTSCCHNFFFLLFLFVFIQFLVPIILKVHTRGWHLIAHAKDQPGM